jgi:hypothetical protein
MSSAAELDNLFQMVSVLEHGMQTQGSAESLLREALPTIQACLPHTLHLYFVSGTGELQSVEGEQEPPAVSEENTMLMYDDQRGTWTMPLVRDGILLGAIEAALPPDDPEAQSRLGLVAWHITQALNASGTQRLQSQFDFRAAASAFR